MKVMIEKEGFNLSSRHDFGNPKDYFSQFKLLVAYNLVTQIDILKQYIFWCETEDRYIQLASTIDNAEPFIVAQSRRNTENLGSELEVTLIDYIKRARHFTGFPQGAIKGGLFSIERFDGLIKELIAEFESNTEKALENKPQLAKLFEDFGLNPHPNENSTTQWFADCPRCRKFYIVFWNNNLYWGCGRCGFGGEGEQEFREAITKLQK